MGRLSRKLTLLDAIVLVAAVAFGLALARAPYLSMNAPHVRGLALVKTRLWLSLIYPAITRATVAVPLLALRRPRPRLGWLVRQPGAGACLAATVALALRGVEVLPAALKGQKYHFGPILPWLETSQAAGYAVMGAWAALAAGAGRRPVALGLDRLGAALGVVWVGAVAMEVFLKWWYV